MLICFSLTWPHKVLEVTKIAKSNRHEKQPVTAVVKRNEQIRILFLLLLNVDSILMARFANIWFVTAF